MAAQFSPTDFAESLLQEFATVVGAMLGSEPLVVESSSPAESGWVVTATASGASTGSVAVGISTADAATLTQLALGADAPPDDTAVVDMLKEVVGQALGSASTKPAAAGCKFSVDHAARGGATPAVQPQTFDVHANGDFIPRVVVWVAIATPKAQAAPAPRTDTRAPAPAHEGAVPANLDVILDIDLPLAVRFGETQMTVDALTRLGPGSLIDLGRSPDDPVDVLVNGRLVARGEVVVVAGNYGVRILQVISATDRIRSMGA